MAGEQRDFQRPWIPWQRQKRRRGQTNGMERSDITITTPGPVLASGNGTPASVSTTWCFAGIAGFIQRRVGGVKTSSTPDLGPQGLYCIIEEIQATKLCVKHIPGREKITLFHFPNGRQETRQKPNTPIHHAAYLGLEKILAGKYPAKARAAYRGVCGLPQTFPPPRARGTGREKLRSRPPGLHGPDHTGLYRT